MRETLTLQKQQEIKLAHIKTDRRIKAEKIKKETARKAIITMEENARSACIASISQERAVVFGLFHAATKRDRILIFLNPYLLAQHEIVAHALEALYKTLVNEETDPKKIQAFENFHCFYAIVLSLARVIVVKNGQPHIGIETLYVYLRGYVRILL